MKNSYSIGISLPKKLIRELDTKRGDISRSKYLARILKEELVEQEAEANIK